MATDKNFIIKNGLTINESEIITSAGNLTNVGTISSGKIGVGANTSSYWAQGNSLVLDDSGNTGLTIKSTSTGNGRVVFTDTTSTTAGLNDGGQIHYGHTNDEMKIRTAGTDAITIDSSQNATFAGNVTLAEYLYHSGNTGTNLRFQTDRATLTSGGGASVDAHSNGNLYLTGTTVQVYGNYNSTGTINSGNITSSGTITSAADINVASSISTGSATLNIGAGRTGNGYAYIDLVGDTTYTDYALRLIRGNSGANTDSQLVHRGTGALAIQASDAGSVKINVNGAQRVLFDSSGKLRMGSSSVEVFDTADQRFSNYSNLGMGKHQWTAVSLTAGNWYEIASGSGRQSGTFTLQDGISGGPHGTVKFFAGCSYGDQANNHLKLIHNSWYINSGVTDVRIREVGTYDTMYVDVYINRTGTYYISLEDTHYATNGWTLASSPSANPTTTGFGITPIEDFHTKLVAEAANSAEQFSVTKSGNATLAGTLTASGDITANSGFLNIGASSTSEGGELVLVKPTSSAASDIKLDNYQNYFRVHSGGSVWATIDSGGISSNSFQISGSTVIDSSSNLTNIGTISSGAITSSGKVQGAHMEIRGATGSSGFMYILDSDNGTSNTDGFLLQKSGNNAFVYNREATGSLSLGAGDTSNYLVIDSSGNINLGITQILDQNRNLTNIGTISSGAITATSAVFGEDSSYETEFPASGATVHIHENISSNGTFGDEAHMVISTGVSVTGEQGYQGSLWFGTSDHPAAGATSGTGTQFVWRNAGIASTSGSGNDTGGGTAYGNLEFYVNNGGSGGTKKLELTNAGDLIASGNATFSGTISSGAITLSNDSSDMGFGTAKAGSTVGHTASVDEGIFWHTTSDYGIYRTAGAWSSPYPVLKIKFVTGVEIDGGVAGQYGDINFSRSNLKIGGTQFLDQSRNLTNIGTISSGAIGVDGDITLTEGDKIKTSESSGGSHLLLRSDNLGVTGNSLSLIGLNDILIGSKSNQTGTGNIYFGYNAESKATGSGWVDTLTITDSGNFEFNNGNFTEVGTISSGEHTITQASDTSIGLKINRSSLTGRSQMVLADQNGSDLWRIGLTGGGSEDFAFFDGGANVLLLDRSSNTAFFSGAISASNVINGLAYQVSGTEVISSSRNLTNIGTISTSGDITVGGNNVTLANVGARVKYSVWSNATYGIGMETGYTFGGIANNYVMSFQMSNTAGRGFWWGDDAHTNAQGAMALTTQGYLTVAAGIRVGYGETDTTTPSSGLDVYGPVTFVQSLADDQTALTITQSNTGSDISTQESFIDFTFIDANGNNYPQVKIGAQVGQNADADSTIKEGSGAFVVHTSNAVDSNAGGQAGMAERFRVDYRGYVGIGTATPNEALDVVGNATLSGNISLSGGTTTNGINLPRGGFITFYGDNGTTHGIGSRNAAGTAADDLRINSYGAVYINLDSNNNNTSGADFIIGRHGGGAGTMSNLFSVSGETGAVISNDNITAYGSASDIRLKENIEVIQNPIDKVQKLRGVTFNYKKDGSKSTGLIAQELEEVLPEVVYETHDLHDDEDKFKAVRYGNIVGLLVEAIKEQQKQIEELKEEVSSLRSKN